MIDTERKLGPNNFYNRLEELKRKHCVVGWGNLEIKLQPIEGTPEEVKSFHTLRVHTFGNDLPHIEGALSNREEIAKWIEGMPKDETRLIYLIRLINSKKPFDGFCGWHNIGYSGGCLSAERTIVIFDPKERGNGYGSLLGWGMLFLAKKLGLELVRAKTEIGNTPSIKNLRNQMGIGVIDGEEVVFKKPIKEIVFPENFKLSEANSI